MINFKEFLAEAAGKNTHMTHLEDAVIYGGVKGARDAIFALRAMRDMLAGNTNKNYDLTVKWDGAPAVFAGIDPSDGQFFVAKKGIFNKNPKVYKSEAEVRADTSGDLADKLSIAYRELKDMGITDVIQGDIMFTKGDVKTETIQDETYYTFQPNTIVYAVPADSKIGKDIKKANLGVVWHTTYRGNDFESMQAQYGVNISGLKKKSSVWYQTAEYRDISGKAVLSKKETKEVTKALSVAGKIFQKIAGNTLRQLQGDPALARHIETFNNTYVRKGQRVTNTTSHVNNLIDWFADRFDKERAKRKTDKGKANVTKKEEEFMKFFSDENKKNLKLIFDLQNALIDAKLLIINKLDKVKQLDTFVRTRNGFKVTGSEGFVAIDKTSDGAVKLIDRLEFSSNNFNPDIIKGWEK